MVVAAGLAIPLQANLPLSVALVWLTNPFTIPPVFYFCYRVGLKVLGMPRYPGNISFTVEALSSELSHIWLPLLTGSILCGVLLAVSSFFITKYVWRANAAKRWKARQLTLKR